MNCDGPNWGENADWCVLHDQDPLLCVSLAREALEAQNRILRKAASAGAKSIKLWLKEGCGCDAEGHVCGINVVRQALEAIEDALTMPDLRRQPTSDRDRKITVREACRRRIALGGTDAQALEHGLTQLEEEKRDIQEKYDALAFRVQMMSLQHPVECADAGLRFRQQMKDTQTLINQQEDEIEAMRAWSCSACGLSLKNDPKFNTALAESRKPKAGHCKSCGVQIHPSGAFCTPCSGDVHGLVVEKKACDCGTASMYIHRPGCAARGKERA